MGWWSKTWKKVKNVFKKVTKVVKKVVKSVGKTAKKVWNKVKGVAKKFSKGISKLGPFANIAMNFIPGFGQLWSAYGIWGQLAKGALVGFATTGEASGAILGAATMGAMDVFNNMPGNTIAQKWNAIVDKMSPKTIEKIATNYGGQPFTHYTPKNTFKSFPKPVDPIYKPTAFDKMLEEGGAGAYHMKDGQLLLGKAPAGTPQMGRSSDYWGAKEVTMTQEAIKAGQYHKPESSLLDRIKDSIPPSINQADSAQATAGMWHPDTSPLTSVSANTTASAASGQAGYGQDANEELIRSLGLVPLLQQYQSGRQLFGA